MQKIGSLMLDAGKYLSGNGKSLIEKLVENARTTKINDVADTFSNLYGTVEQKAAELGGSVSDIFVRFFSQDPEKIGEGLGSTMGAIVGSISFDTLLGIVTAGAAAAAKRGLTVARSFVQPLLNLLVSTGQKAVSGVQGVWNYARRITTSARTGILTWIKKVSAELGAKVHAIVESIENFVERLLTRANKGKKAEAELASELAEQKAVQLVPALAQAKAITVAQEKIGAPVRVLLTTLNILKKRFRWIKGFQAVPKPAPGHYRIDMLASEHVLDEDYNAKKEIPTPDWEIPKAVTDKRHPSGSLIRTREVLEFDGRSPQTQAMVFELTKGIQATAFQFSRLIMLLLDAMERL